ncbi:ATP-binding protein [Candidatus Woesebacteria bacterium]|nr:ATP-binding protein [Candidatus Woesebacteria bacterium]
MTTLHLISGLPCSGKTTYAHNLQKEVKGIVFSLDTWLITLYGRYDIDDVGHDEHVKRVLACRALIWGLAQDLLSRNIDVILDDGFFLSKHRKTYTQQAKKNSAATITHYLTAPIPTIKKRIAKRNQDPAPFTFVIRPELIDDFIAMFEEPSEKEGTTVIVIKNDD